MLGRTAKNNAYAYVLAFFSGMCIMSVELSASRLMAPFFGTSTYVWTNIIGIIMIALSLGYLFGGKIADRRPYLDVLLWMILSACAFLFLVPFVTPSLVRWIMSAIDDINSSFLFLFIGSLIAIALLFSVPIFILGMTSPFLIRLTATADHIGKSSGHIFAISTIGSIIGTFLPVLVFIPLIGTAKTIIFFTLVLFLVTVAGFSRRKYYLLFPLGIIFFFLTPPASRSNLNIVHSTESSYQYIEVLDDKCCRYLAYNDGAGFQTVLRRDGVLSGYYFDYYSVLPLLLNESAVNVLLIGLGGGTIADQLFYFYQGDMQVDAVEVDPKVIDISKRYFFLDPRTHVYNQDGRIFLRKTAKKYDIIITDAYIQQIYIPFHLVTREFFQEVKARLERRGIMAMNVNASGQNSRLLKALINTLSLVFANVYEIKEPAGDYNYIIIASDSEIDFRRLERGFGTGLQTLARYCLLNNKKVGSDPMFLAFTDDKAPIEYMVDWDLVKRKRTPRL